MSKTAWPTIAPYELRRPCLRHRCRCFAVREGEHRCCHRARIGEHVSEDDRGLGVASVDPVLKDRVRDFDVDCLLGDLIPSDVATASARAPSHVSDIDRGRVALKRSSWCAPGPAPCARCLCPSQGSHATCATFTPRSPRFRAAVNAAVPSGVLSGQREGCGRGVGEPSACSRDGQRVGPSWRFAVRVDGHGRRRGGRVGVERRARARR